MSKKISQPKAPDGITPENANAIIRKAVAVCRLPPGERRREGMLRLLSRTSPIRDLITLAQPNLSTATWTVATNGSRRYHRIVVGEDFHRFTVERVRVNRRKLQRYCESLIRHEVAHGLFTDPNIGRTNQLCKQAGVPFGLLNLLEDARIEHLERERSKDPVTGQPWRFHWWCFSPLLKETDHPGGYFWALITKEASSWDRYSAGAPRWLGRPGADARIRDHYYHQAIHAARTEDLIALGQEWIAEFPIPSKPSQPLETNPKPVMKATPAHHHVYVIELDRAVLSEKRFLKENPTYDGKKACLYVGCTGLTPEERLKNHLTGTKSGKYPHKYGRWLRPRLYRKFNPMSYEDAAACERQLALDLRAEGYAVWQR